MKTITNVTTYLQKHGPALAGRIAERFKPLVTAPQLDVRRELRKLEREPFPAQAGVIEGLPERRQRRRGTRHQHGTNASDGLESGNCPCFWESLGSVVRRLHRTGYGRCLPEGASRRLA